MVNVLSSVAVSRAFFGSLARVDFIVPLGFAPPGRAHGEKDGQQYFLT